jgi:hypothetical protein
MRTIAAGAASLFLLAFLVTDSNADPGGGGYRKWHCVKDFWGNCDNGGSRWRHHHRRHYRNDDNGHRAHHHHHNHHEKVGGIDRGVFCHPRRRVVGEERPSKSRARRAADDAWMGAVRYDHGERFQDLNHAKDVRHNCDPSSTSSVLKRVHFRCVVEATPCRAPTGATEEKVERRYEEDDNDDDDDRRSDRRRDSDDNDEVVRRRNK